MKLFVHKLGIHSACIGMLIASSGTLAFAQSQTAKLDQNGNDLKTTLTLTDSPGSDIHIQQSGGADSIDVSVTKSASAFIGEFDQIDTQGSRQDIRLSNTSIGGYYKVAQAGGSNHQVSLNVDGAANGAVDVKQEGDGQKLDLQYSNVSNTFSTISQKGSANSITEIAANTTGETNFRATQDGTGNDIQATLSAAGSTVEMNQTGTNNSINYSSR